MKTIAIFMQNRDFFGAQIVHIPLIKALKKEYPNHTITLFSKHSISTILQDFVDEIVIEQGKFSTMRKYLSIKADISINLRKRSSLINLYIALFNRHQKIGFDSFLTKLFFNHTKEHNSTIYRAQNYLNLIDQTIAYDSIQKEKRIIIIPGAGEGFKIYPLHHYLTLATKLSKRFPEYEIAFVLGQKEINMRPDIEKGFKVYESLAIAELFSVIQSASLVITNDCGPSHIAQISSLPHIILYSDEKGSGEAVKQEWFNPKENAQYLLSKSNQSIDTIEVDDIFRVATKLLD